MLGSGNCIWIGGAWGVLGVQLATAFMSMYSSKMLPSSTHVAKNTLDYGCLYFSPALARVVAEADAFGVEGALQLTAEGAADVGDGFDAAVSIIAQAGHKASWKTQ